MNIKTLLTASALFAAVLAPTVGEAQVRHHGRTVVVRSRPHRIYRPARRVRVIRHRPYRHRRHIVAPPIHRHRHH